MLDKAVKGRARSKGALDRHTELVFPSKLRRCMGGSAVQKNVEWRINLIADQLLFRPRYAIPSALPGLITARPWFEICRSCSHRPSCSYAWTTAPVELVLPPKLCVTGTTRLCRSLSCRGRNSSDGGADVGAEGESGQEREKQLLLRPRQVSYGNVRGGKV